MQQATPQRVWLNYTEAEAYTGLQRTTIWRAVRDGRLRAGGLRGTPRFHRDDLDSFMRGDKLEQGD